MGHPWRGGGRNLVDLCAGRVESLGRNLGSDVRKRMSLCYRVHLWEHRTPSCQMFVCDSRISQ